MLGESVLEGVSLCHEICLPLPFHLVEIILVLGHDVNKVHEPGMCSTIFEAASSNSAGVCIAVGDELIEYCLVLRMCFVHQLSII